MTIQIINKTVLHCRCVWCGHEWDTFVKPKRCAKCKRHTWNGEDLRQSDPLEFVPPGSVVDDDDLPEMRRKELLNALMLSRGIIEQLVADYGPCNHPKDRSANAKEDCVCREKKVLAKVNQQIETISQFADSRRVPYVRIGQNNNKAKPRKAKARA